MRTNRTPEVVVIRPLAVKSIARKDTFAVGACYTKGEVNVVRYEQFWPGDRVITIVDYEGIPSGTVGTIASRWMGTAYAVRLPDGTFQWINNSELSSMDPNRHYLREGDIGIVTSSTHQNNFAQLGDIYQVYKVAHEVDYYGVIIDNELRWLGGFQLAKYL